jgi:hypothetical protein
MISYRLYKSEKDVDACSSLSGIDVFVSICIVRIDDTTSIDAYCR